MGFTLAQASQSLGTYPCPTAPPLRDAYRRALPRRIAGILVVWSSLFSFGFAVPFLLVLTGAASRIGLDGAERWIAAATVPLLCGLLAVTAGRGLLHGAWVRLLGYCRATMPSAGGPFSRAPVTVSGASSGLLSASAALSALIGFACMLMLGDPEPWAIAVGALVALGLSALFGARAVKRLRSASAGWREEQRRLTVAAAVRREGVHAVATVAEAVFLRTWIDGLPVFRISAEFDDGSAIRRVSFRYVEFPCWAPTEGDAFDLWFDPEHPDDGERIVLERRLLGTEPAGDPESFRRPAQGGDGPPAGPLEPRWAKASEPSPSRRLAYGFGFLFAAGALLCQAIVAAAWFVADSPPWWVVASLAAGFAATLVGVWLRLRPVVSPRSTIRSTGAELVPVSVGVLAAVVALVIAGETVWAMAVSEPFTGMAGEAGAIALFGSIIGGVLVLFNGIAFEAPLAVALASNPAVPPEVVQEALRSGDPTALARLETEYGCTAGPLHLRG